MSTSLADHLHGLADALAAHPTCAERLRLIQATENLLATEKIDAAHVMAERAEHESEGFSTVKAWLRQELRLDTSDVNALISAHKVLTDVPGARESAGEGALTLEHYRPLRYAVRHLAPDIVADNADWMLDLAAKTEPELLRQAVRRLRETVYPEELDRAWMRGMDKRDLTVTPVPDGWHVRGFLDVQTGAKLATVLQSLSEPTEGGDRRTAAVRRVAGLDQLLDAILANGLPSDNGVRPHLTLTVDLQELADDAVEWWNSKITAELAGFGRIGPKQLQQMICDADLTPILTAGKHAVLDVGRTRRLATGSQRKAILHRQRRRCAGPGCRHPIAHFHHLQAWAKGGPTDLDNLVGLCAKCHTAVHLGVLAAPRAYAPAA